MNSKVQDIYSNIFLLISEFQKNSQIPTAPLNTPISLLKFTEDSDFSTDMGSPTHCSSTLTSMDSLSPIHRTEAKSSESQEEIEENSEWNKECDDLVVKLTKNYRFDWKKIKTRVYNLTKHAKDISFLKTRYLYATGKMQEKISVRFSKIEDLKIMAGIEKHGLDWDVIGKEIERSPASVKNRYYYLTRSRFEDD